MSTGTRTRVVADQRTPDSAPPRRTVRYLGIVIALLLGLVFVNGIAGRFTDPSPESASPAAADRTVAPAAAPAAGTVAIPPAPGASRLVGTVPVGYQRTAEGAIAAATNYVTLLYGNPAMLDPATARQVVNTLALPGKGDELLAAMQPGIDSARLALGIGPTGAATAGKATAYRLVPFGYSVVSHDETQAQVAVWYAAVVGVAAPDSRFPPSAVFGTETVTLSWVEDDWKWASFVHTDGPTPVAAPVEPSTVSVMADALTRFTPYGYGGKP